jgi:CTP:molybdopterin cytidylyltransferase MocA
MGGPKALLRDDRGVPYLDRAVGALLEGGCADVVVVLGAEAEEARAVLGRDGWLDDPDVRVVEAGDWDEGMGASLRSGLAALPSHADTVLVTLVDLPDVGAEVVDRMVAVAAGRTTLARATYHGRPGHPVLLGRDHWAGVAATATGDTGARDYLATRDVRAVECGDLATGRDMDRPGDV